MAGPEKWGALWIQQRCIPRREASPPGAAGSPGSAGAGCRTAHPRCGSRSSGTAPLGPALPSDRRRSPVAAREPQCSGCSPQAAPVPPVPPAARTLNTRLSMCSCFSRLRMRVMRQHRTFLFLSRALTSALSVRRYLCWGSSLSWRPQLCARAAWFSRRAPAASTQARLSRA